MPDANRDPKRGERASATRPRHAVPSLYAPSPRESVVAAGLAVTLLTVLALVLAGAGGSASAERNGKAADGAKAAAAHPAKVVGAGLLQAEGPAGYGKTFASLPISGSTSPTLAPGLGIGGIGAVGGTGFGGTGAASSLAASGIPATALAAYQQAVARQNRLTPGCRISWPLLAGIGRIESNHGRFAGAVLHTDGRSTPPVVGIPLNGNGTAVIRDTDGGRLDGDAVYDRAVGPMQFIPSTWASWGVDADRDGKKNPYDIFDAAAAAAAYLCAAGRDVSTYQGQVAAILSYNHSMAYVSSVMGVERVYARSDPANVLIVPTAPGPGSSGPIASPTLPPVDPGTPRGVGSTAPRKHSSSPRSQSSAPRPSSSRSSSHPSSHPASHTTSKPPTKTSTTPSCPASSTSSTGSSTPTAPTSTPTTPTTPTSSPSTTSSCGSSSKPTSDKAGAAGAAAGDGAASADSSTSAKAHTSGETSGASGS